MKLPVKDRIAQHMWNNIVEPIFNKRFYYHSYACRKGKGLHAASKALSSMLYSLYKQGIKTYAIKGDIYNYFWNIHHDILLNQICRFIGDDKTIALTNEFISSNGIAMDDGVGIPVGNLSSQLFANIYGNILDEFILNELHCNYYIRYMDDFVILGNNYKELENILNAIQQMLWERMRCVLNDSSTILYANDGITFVGFKHFPDHVIPSQLSYSRFIHFVNGYINGVIPTNDIIESYTCRVGHLGNCDFIKVINYYNNIIIDSIPKVVVNSYYDMIHGYIKLDEYKQITAESGLRLTTNNKGQLMVVKSVNHPHLT